MLHVVSRGYCKKGRAGVACSGRGLLGDVGVRVSPLIRHDIFVYLSLFENTHGIFRDTDDWKLRRKECSSCYLLMLYV